VDSSLGWNFNPFASLRVTANAGWSVVETEDAKPTNLNSAALGKLITDAIKDYIGHSILLS